MNHAQTLPKVSYIIRSNKVSITYFMNKQQKPEWDTNLRHCLHPASPSFLCRKQTHLKVFSFVPPETEAFCLAGKALFVSNKPSVFLAM